MPLPGKPRTRYVVGVLTLLVLQGPDKGRRFELPDEQTLIGRGSERLPLSDNTVSRRHAELHPRNSEWVLKDLGSSNGTWVNGIRVSNTYNLKLGDQIRVGRSLLVFGAQPGVARVNGRNLSLAGEEAGMDSAIMHAVSGNEDSMVLAVPEPAAAAMASLRILYQLSAALGSTFNSDQIFDVVMDLVFETVKADRGFILLVDDAGNITPKIVRRRDADEDKTPPEQQQITASRTIINHVLQSGEGVLSSNAMADRLFSKSKSVHDMGIRSALCVPIKSKRLDSKGGEENVGVIYIDSSVKNYTYSPDQLRLLTAIGLQAGMALQNAKLYQQGLAAERLAAIGETTAALSHSIKNILQALTGGADVVELGFKANNIGQAGKGWRVVDRNLKKIMSLTTNLLAYSKPREPQLELVQPRSLINDCLELLAPTANEKGVMCVADVDRDQPPIPADPDGLHQALVNLISNAIDAAPAKSGLIRVVCRYEPESKQSIIEVIDNGVGIEPSMMKHLFELFHSTKGNRGTGLGLAVTKKIVEEHEGSIIAKSTPGDGTTFVIRLPTRLVGDLSGTFGPTR